MYGRGDADDALLYALENAPVGEPLNDEERALLGEAELGEAVPHEVVHGMIERCTQAMKRFGAAGENADVTVGEILRWLDTGEASPAIAGLIATEHATAAE